MKVKKMPIIISLIALLSILFVVFAVMACASSKNDFVDATVEIEANLSEYKLGDTITVDNDGYIGIPVKVSTYYDTAKGATKPGYNGTPLIVYVVNTMTERIGKKSDVDIISSMLERGYIVQVLDYMNNEKAVSPDLDWSTQTIRQNFKKGSYLKGNDALKSGTYYDTIVLPAGYDVSLGNIFWEADKHGADGTLDKIVENWNTDLRGWFRDTVIYWRNSLGDQKATQVGLDGTDPVWYSDAKGTNAVEASSPDAKYVKVQHTLAVDVTDCTGKDGTPIDLNLYMHVVYPTTTEEDPLDAVPVIALANSSEYLSNGLNTADRPQFSGFLFNGYAGVVFDYLYQPMAQSDYFGYYDGRTEHGALTGDRMNYGLQLYDDKRINTAAMRYVRYLTLTEPETYSFDTDAIGVYGNSKGGWFTFLGEAELREPTEVSVGETLAEAMDARINAYTPKRTFENATGKTRYQNAKTEGYTKNGVYIDGGEIQPWLTYVDASGVEHEIPSYASWIYASNGGNAEDITAGHAPTFCALHMQDDFTTTGNAFGEITGILNIPSFYTIVDLGHTFAYGPDYHYGYDAYQAMFDFANYYLRGDAVKVVYTDPITKTGLMSTTDGITVKFSGAVLESEIAKVTLVASDGTVATGSWTSVRGGTEWTFAPDALKPGAEYVLTVPQGFAGDNGVKTESEYTAVFHTERESVSVAGAVSSNNGTYFTVTVPEASDASDAVIRFHVENDAANIAELYLVTNYNSASVDESVIGEKVGSVNLFGAGYYEIDVSKYVLSATPGSDVVFLLKAGKKATVTNTYNASFASSLSEISLGSYVRGSVDEAPDGTRAAKLYVTTNINSSGKQQYAHEVFYANTTSAFSNNKLLGTSALTEADLGRQYRVTLRVYDTVSRVVEISLNAAYANGNNVHDYNRVYFNTKTEAGKWMEISFDYTVYESIYGDGALQRKTLTVKLGSTGCDESPIYMADIAVMETVTGIDLASDAGALVLGYRGDAYKADSAENPFKIGSTSYATLNAALSAAKSGDTVTMGANYTLTASDNFAIEKLSAITLDLNGYSIYADSKYPLVNAKATSLSVPKTIVNIKNGSIYLSDAPLVGYAGSSSAGDGKVFNINLTNVNVLNSQGSRLSSVLSENTIDASSGATVNIKLDGCTVDFDKNVNTEVNNITVFPNGTSPLTVNYEICGGEIKLKSFITTTLWEVFKKVELTKDSDGNYTALIAPESASIPSIAVMRSDGIATYTAKSVTDHAVTYTAEKSELSTKYGIIPEEYASVEDYPFVLFDEKGNFKSAYNAFIGNGDNGDGGVLGAAKSYVVNAWNGTSYGTDPKEAFIVMRRDYTFDSSRDVKLNNLAQLQGTINIDLCGYTLSSGTVSYPIFPAFSKGYSGAAGNKIFPSTIVVNNGTLRSYQNGIVGMSTWDSVGGGTIADKHFNFIFNNVTIGFVDNAAAAGLTAHGRDKTGTPGAAAPFNFTYNDCTFDLRTYKSRYNPTIFALSTVANRFIKLTIEVNGGQIIADDASKVTVIGTTTSDTYGSSIVFKPNSDGEYLKYYVPTGSTAVASGAYVNENGETCGFTKVGTEGTDDVYTLDINPLVTKYGTITDAYKSAETYPFAVFDADTKEFIGAFSTFKAAIDKAKARQGNNVWDKTTGNFTGTPVSSVILLRRDYTTVSGDNYDNYGQIKGTVTIDLGGYAMDQGVGVSGLLWLLTIKGWGGNVYPTVMNIKNGAFNVYSKALLQMRVWATVDMNYRPFTINFDNVDFGFVSGATTSNLLIEYAEENTGSGYSSTVATKFNVNFNDCNFDLVTNAPSKDVKLFNAAGGEKVWIKTTITVKGGEIKAPKLSLAQLYSVETKYGSSVKFVKDDEGNYTKLYITNGGAAPSGDISTDNGTMSYVKTTTGSSETLYTLSSLKTPYGTIPSNRASIEDYPFVVFDTDGNYYGAFANLLGSQAGAMGNAIYTVLRDYNKWDEASGKYVPDEGSTGVRTAIIYLRRDYTMTASEYHNNLAHTQGTIIIDLGGHTIYSDSSRTRPVFDCTAKGWSTTDDGNLVFPSTFIVKNGEFRNHSSSVLQLICQDSVGGNAIAKKVVTWTFENVTFGIMKGATSASPVILIADAKTTSGVLPANITFNDCTFDFASVAPTVKTTVINAAFGTKSYTKGTITVNGGKLLANNLTNVVIYALDTKYGSSITFGKGSDGKYFETHLTSGAAAPAYTLLFNADSVEATLTHSSTVNGMDIYTLEASIVTKYGNIPARFASAEDYPFAVFKNGQFVCATHLFGKDASESALHKSKDAGSVVLLRRDFTYNEARYQNLSQTYSVTIDLGGFTFISTANHEIFYAQTKTSHDTTVKVINGTIIVSAGPVIRYSSWGGASTPYTGGGTFALNFEDVTFKLANGATTNVMMAVSSVDLPEPEMTGVINLTDCVIDISGANGVTLFDFADNSGVIKGIATVTGGKIIADSFEGIKVANLAAGNGVTFAKGEDGEYAILNLKDGGKTPEEHFATAEGDLAYVRTATDGEFGVYKLGEAELTKFTPKISITLYSDFIFNIYIPKNENIETIELDGVSINVSELEVTVIDGAEFYTLHKSQPAKTAAEIFRFRVGVNVGGKTVYGNWSVSIVKYANLVLNDDESTETEKTLMKDILSYVRSAYVYFERANAAEVKAQIDSVIGADYDSESRPVDKEAATVGSGFDSATFKLDAAPAFVFYPETDENGNLLYSPDAYTFTLGGKVLAKEVCTKDDGTVYFLVTAYAYGIAENISYSIEGTDISGEYNVKTYYEYAKTLNDDNLVSVVERLWKYSESAKAYKIEVTSK